MHKIFKNLFETKTRQPSPILYPRYFTKEEQPIAKLVNFIEKPTVLGKQKIIKKTISPTALKF